MTGTILPPPPPTAGESYVPSLEGESRPPRRRRRWVFVVAALVLVVGGVAVYAATSSTEDEPRSADVEQGSSDQVVRERIAAATEAAAAARTARHVSAMTIDGVEVMTTDFVFDHDAGLYAMAMDVDSSLFDGDDSLQMEMILDQEEGMWYVGANALDYPTDADWVSIDVAAMVAPLGISPDELQSDASAPFLNIVSLLDSAHDVVDLGVEELDEVEVRHLQITLGTDEFLAANPDVLETVETEGIEDDMPQEIPYDLWITESNQLRRTAFVLAVDGMEMLTETNFMSVGDPVDIKIPAPQDVVDMADLEGDAATDQTESGSTEDALHSECEAGSGEACDALLMISEPFSDEELFALTCGNRFTVEEAPELCAGNI